MRWARARGDSAQVGGKRSQHVFGPSSCTLDAYVYPTLWRCGDAFLPVLDEVWVPSPCFVHEDDRRSSHIELGSG